MQKMKRLTVAAYFCNLNIGEINNLIIRNISQEQRPASFLENYATGASSGKSLFYYFNK